MMTTDVVGNTGTRFLGGILSAEMIAVFHDMRWMLLLIALCVIADFRYGWGESSRRYSEAVRKGDKLMMVQYQWRTSRAVRRTMNKLIDYLIWVVVGMSIGMAILEPIGVNHIFGGVVATAIAVTCESKSFFGHFFYLHGVNVEQKTLVGFFKAFFISLLKRKNEDLGEAVEDGFDKVKGESDHGKS